MRRSLHPLVEDALRSLAPPLLILALQLLRMAILPERVDWDPIAHLLGGASIAMGALILASRWRARKIIPLATPAWLVMFAIWGAVALAGIFWEFFEFGTDLLWGWNAQINLPDTMNDLLVDLTGGVVYLLYFRYFSPFNPFRGSKIAYFWAFSRIKKI